MCALIERHLPSDRRDVPTLRYVRQKLDEAARGGDAMDIAVAVQIALHLEGVECQLEVRPTAVYVSTLVSERAKAEGKRR